MFYNKSTQLVENLGGNRLGANRSVQLIKVGERLFVVGVGENIQLLKKLKKDKNMSKLFHEL